MSVHDNLCWTVAVLLLVVLNVLASPASRCEREHTTPPAAALMPR